MKSEILANCQQLVAAAVNGTYQGILIAVLVAAGLQRLRRSNAATRYAVWFGTLLLLALIIPAHFLRNRWDSRVIPATTVETPASVLALKPDLDVIRMEASPVRGDSEGEFEVLVADTDSARNNREPDVDCATAQQCLDIGTGPGKDSESPKDSADAIVLAQVEQSAAPEPGFLAGVRQSLRWLGKRLVTPVSPWKVAARTPLFIAALLPIIWLAIAVAKVSFLVWQLFRIRKLKLNSVEAKPELDALFLSLRESIGVHRNVTLRVSTECKSPVVLGFFKPVILLPADAGLKASEHVLRHELAHVRRCDDWANLVQQTIKALFFFHPAIWWVSKRISLEREIACDDQVLQSPLRPKAYALLLADLAGRMQPSVLAPGVSTNQSQLKQRIDMILNLNRNTSPRLAKARLGLLATATALLALVAIYSAPRLAFAQSAPAAPPAPAAAPVPAPALPPGPSSAAITSLAPPAAIALPADEAPSLPPAPPTVILTAPYVPTGPKFKPGSAVSVDVQPGVAPRPSVLVLTAPSAALAPAAPTATVPAVPAAPLVASTDLPSLPGQPGTIAVLTTPAAALVPVAPVAAVPTVTATPLVASADFPSQPGQPPAPRPAVRSAKDPAVEERLERLEKMVESLVAQQKGKPNQFEYYSKMPPGEMKFKPSPDSGNQWEQKQAEMAKKQAEYDMKRDDLAKRMAELGLQNRLSEPRVAGKNKELAEQDAKIDQAAREAQRAEKDAQRGRSLRKMRDGLPQELDALRKQRDMLEKQMEKLERQIDKLESEKEKLEEQQENDEQGADVEQNQNVSNKYQPGECSNNYAISSRQPAPQ